MRISTLSHLYDFLTAIFILTGIFVMYQPVRGDIPAYNMYSESMDRAIPYSVYVPEDAEPDDRFATLFVLHGAWGNHRDWIERARIEEYAKNYRMILVFPDGDQFGWYLDSPREPGSQFETHVTKELVAEIDAKFPTLGTREGRAICGLSMGGNGALMLTARHPDVFSAASGMSSIFDLTKKKDYYELQERLGFYDENEELWKSYSAYFLADKFVENNIPVMFDCGVSDTRTRAIGMLRDMHTRLIELEHPHISREFVGGHSWSYWDGHIEEHLNFHQAYFLEETKTFRSRFEERYFTLLREYLEQNAKSTINGRTDDRPHVIMLGSSSSESFSDELLPEYKLIKRGISSDHFGIEDRPGVLQRIESSVFDVDADAISFLMGRNDLGDLGRNGEPSIYQITQALCQVIETIQARRPDTPLIIYKVGPVSGRYAFLSDLIFQYNETVEKIGVYYGVPVIDLYTPFVDENGMIAEEFTTDGLHFSEAGYQHWAAELDRTLKEVLSPVDDAYREAQN